MAFSVTREIQIDMGHRVHTHGSQCWNIHGHRYRILAQARSVDLQGPDSDVQRDMVMDFSFLKGVMMGQIFDFCDHGLTLCVEDPWLGKFISPTSSAGEKVVKNVELHGYHHIPYSREAQQTKLLVVPFIPTAEALAKFWFGRMQRAVQSMSGEHATLHHVQVYETPNCHAIYPA